MPVSEPAASRLRWFLLTAWTLLLCVVPDPRPLGAPEWAVSAVTGLTGLAEPAARVVTSYAMRAGGLALLGTLLMFAVGTTRWNRRSLLAVLLAPGLAIVTLWVNVGNFPIGAQVQLATVSAALGAIAGLALARNTIAALAFVTATAGLFAWGTSNGISDDEAAATRATARHILAAARDIPDGDAGFARVLEVAFAYAADNSHGTDPVPANRAAVLALAVILGGEQIAAVARRHIDMSKLGEVEALRARIALHGRTDWPRHYFASAGLALLSDAERSIAVGVTKELMDATPGGSGFSFADLAADAAGNRFARAATRDANAARAMQDRLRSGAHLADFVPDMRGLPEGLSADAFHERYGGLGGAGTRDVVADIERRLAACGGLRAGLR